MSPTPGDPPTGPHPPGRIEPAPRWDALPAHQAERGSIGSTAPGRLLAVLDDTRTAGTLLDISCVLAELMRRELELVYVESAAALAAAALPTTQVLAQATARWTPLAAPDVERAWLADAGRLRALAAQATRSRALAWSLQVTRGTLRETALALQAQSDLLLVGGTAAALAEVARTDHRAAARTAGRQAPPSTWRRRVVALDDGSAAGQQAVAIAQRLCSAMGAHLDVRRFDPTQAGPSWLVRPDLVVMPGPWAAPGSPVGPARTPTLLVNRWTSPGG